LVDLFGHLSRGYPLRATEPNKETLALVLHDHLATLRAHFSKEVPISKASKKSGNIFRVGIFLDFVRPTPRAPHGAHVRRAKRNRVNRRSPTMFYRSLSGPEKGRQAVHNQRI